jgi:UDP-N-acetylmuramate--alanine ligase
VSPSQTVYTLEKNGKAIAEIKLKVPGEHNVLNSVAACAAALQAGAKPGDLAGGLADFRGAGRRFEFLGKNNGVEIADDYAHHPAEIRATLNVAKSLGYKTVWAVFQPFTYSRTAMLMDDFADALKIADRVVMSEIMGSREVNTYNVYTKDLAEKIPGSAWFPTFEEIADYVMRQATPGDLVLTMSCGDIYKCARMMLNFSVTGKEDC